MTRFARRLRVLAGLLIVSMPVACGGGGGGNGANPPPPPPPASFFFLTTTLADAVVGVPYNQTLRVSGGSGARTFAVASGSLPDGLTLQTSTGVISGTPAGPVGTADFSIEVVDSSSPPLDVAQPFSLTVNATSLGRNNTIADATPVGNGTFAASISPSGDPAILLDPDEDFYAVTTTADSTVTIDINAALDGSPLDSVIELVSSNGTRLATCVAPDFTSPCVNDDEDLDNGNLDSFLQARIAGNSTFYVHVVDWGSNARPDLVYDLVISGVN
jgi:hypothetical protein